jgi:Zn-dependent protease with chaperone function
MVNWAIAAISGLAGVTFGLSGLVSGGLILASYEWLRKAELSADRAALLVMDELNPVLHTMMRLAGGSSRYANEVSLQEFLRQSERYQELDQDGLNQVYKFLLYNNLAEGVFLTHPFNVERVKYLQEWSTSEEYRQIRAGNYRRSGEGAVEVKVESPASSADRQEVETLQREIEELQREIDQIKRSHPNS